jgi:hypothetical protein
LPEFDEGPLTSGLFVFGRSASWQPTPVGPDVINVAGIKSRGTQR